VAFVILIGFLVFGTLVPFGADTFKGLLLITKAQLVSLRRAFLARFLLGEQVDLYSLDRSLPP
jgi:hypothetical protein